MGDLRIGQTVANWRAIGLARRVHQDQRRALRRADAFIGPGRGVALQIAPRSQAKVSFFKEPSRGTRALKS